MANMISGKTMVRFTSAEVQMTTLAHYGFDGTDCGVGRFLGWNRSTGDAIVEFDDFRNSVMFSIDAELLAVIGE